MAGVPTTAAADDVALAEAARVWALELPAVRREIAREASGLAQPRIWTDTVGALATTAWRAVSAAAPDAPVVLLTAAARAMGAPIAPPDASAGTVKRAQRLVRAGGPAYIKLGQFIASADGLLPRDWVEAFAWCRDDAPPIDFAVVEDLIAREIGADALAELDPEPLAAGSIGQVHVAKTASGEEVVVKVRRPGLRSKLRSDIGGLALGAAAAERLHEGIRFANLGGFLELFAQLTLEELDFRLEAQNLVESAAIFEGAGMDFVRVPRPLPELVTKRVVVMERVPGVSYDKAPEVLGADVDGERLLRVAIGGVLTATIVHGVFHGDLHAGNVLVTPDGDFSLVDFGICGRLDERQRGEVARYLMAFAASDAAGQIDALAELGAIPPTADRDALLAELTAEVERLERREDGAVTFERLGDSVGRLLRVLARNGFRMPKDLVLFFKNLLYLSSFAAAIAPGADLFEAVQGAVGDVGSTPADDAIEPAAQSA
ncbi:AarF/ABC1/UbiB kinase family protein [Thermoleophilia bacterium SCSIO 60948]|nr:AarF/ABC1/UbiB kinase family protein [Thermoleophilia bacterium SCSIO 60948]